MVYLSCYEKLDIVIKSLNIYKKTGINNNSLSLIINLINTLKKQFIKSTDVRLNVLIDKIRTSVNVYDTNINNASIYSSSSSSKRSYKSKRKKFKLENLFKNTYMSCNAKLELIQQQLNNSNKNKSGSFVLNICINIDTVKDIIKLIKILKNGILSRSAHKLDKILQKLNTRDDNKLLSFSGIVSHSIKRDNMNEVLKNQLITEYKKRYNLQVISEYIDYKNKTRRLNTFRSLADLIQSNLSKENISINHFFTLQSYHPKFPIPGNSIYKLLDYNAVGKICYIEIGDSITETRHKITLTSDEFGFSSFDRRLSSSSSHNSIKIKVLLQKDAKIVLNRELVPYKSRVKTMHLPSTNQKSTSKKDDLGWMDEYIKAEKEGKIKKAEQSYKKTQRDEEFIKTLDRIIKEQNKNAKEGLEILARVNKTGK